MTTPTATANATAKTEVILDYYRLQSLLPHRPPLLMLDRVRLIPAEKRAIGLRNMTINEPHFQGHFPGNPVLPGVLILEAMVQRFCFGNLNTTKMSYSRKAPGYERWMDSGAVRL